MANQHMSADKELFLDILTKEEREALLTKKMEEIRKKNEALRKRHEEIEADKRQAEKMIKPSSPTKEKKTVEFNTGKKEEFHRHSGSDFEYLRSRTDFDYLRSRTDFELPFDGEVKRRQKAPGRGKGPGGRGRERPKSLDENGGPHLEPPFRGRRSMHATIPGGGGGHRLERVATMPDQEMNEIQIQITGNVSEHLSSFANSRQTRDKHRDRERERPADVNGPPPDPAYNFLADKRREGPAPERGDRDSGGGGGGGSSGRGGKGGGGGGGMGGNIEDVLRQKDHRRHPKNYGGTDFQNVKTKMKMARDKQTYTGSSSQSKMEMSISMTGRERRQYMEWKAERERVDKERIERQKSASGEWRREWDAEKIPQDFEEGSGSKRQEPNRRPAAFTQDGLSHLHQRRCIKEIGTGRIGSGRFDRGERDDRQRGEAPGSKENAELKRTKIGEKIEKGKKLLGRGRGRGRGISATARNRVLPPSLANDSRKVECTRDLLVVKIDNSPGAGDDVEVEYSDTDGIAAKTAGNISSSVGIAIPTCQSLSHASATSSYSKSCPTHSSTAPAEKMWGTIQENSWDQSQAAKQNGERHRDDDDDEDVMLEDEYIEDGELYEGMYEDAENDPHYALMHGMADGDDWEECAEDEEYYVDGNDLAYDDGDKSREPLRVECQLNPEAPAFVPTSPELIKTPPGDTDNPKWGSEVTPNISKSSGGDSSDDDNNNNSNSNNEKKIKDPDDNCCSSSNKISSAIVEEKDKVQDAKETKSAPITSSTSSFESDPDQDGPKSKTPASSALNADPENKDSNNEDKDKDTKPTTPNCNESTKTSVSDDEDEEEEFKDTTEIFDEDHSKKDNDNDNTKNKQTEISNNNNNNNNNKDNISTDKTDSISEKTNTILEDENKKIQNNNSELVKESSTVSSTEKKSSEESKPYSSNTVHTVTVKETIQTVKDAGAWKLSVKEDVESLLMYKNQGSDIIESNSFDRSVSTVGSSGKSLANELLEAEFGNSQASLKMAAHTSKTSSSSSSTSTSSSSSNQPVTCQDSDTADASSKGTGTDGAKTEQSEVSDLSNAGPTKAEATL